MNLKKIFEIVSEDGFVDVFKDPFVIVVYSILFFSLIFRGCI
tara:strand:+ start:14822 stop:14947 length:126 start_codon:yes stop_codon:yes gene_type:complete